MKGRIIGLPSPAWGPSRPPFLGRAAAPRTAVKTFVSKVWHELPSPSGKGIALTPRHSAVRVRQGAPASLAQRKSARSTCERRADRYREDAPVQATTQPV